MYKRQALVAYSKYRDWPNFGNAKEGNILLEDPAEIEELATKIRKMKETGTHLCCSIGLLTEKQARILKEAGLDRINHNLNSSRAFYPNICSTHTFDQRVANIKLLEGLGYEICSGGIIGMGESKEDVVDMLLEDVYKRQPSRYSRNSQSR